MGSSGSIQVFEDVAARKLSPEEGAALLLAEDKRRADRYRPAWAPLWLWHWAGASLAVLAALVGVRRPG